jgi:hypothetical protein
VTGPLEQVEPFEPLRPMSRRRLVLRAVIAPFLWLVGLMVVAVVMDRGNAILVGLVIALGSLVLSVLVLAMVSGLRDRERRRSDELR